MSWQEFNRTLRDSTFAMWFGWSVIVTLLVFPVTNMFIACGEQSTREDIEMAKLDAQHGDRETRRIDTVKWMVSRGINPLVARCAVYNSPHNQCATMMNSLEDEDRSVITELIRNPGELDSEPQIILEEVEDEPFDPTGYIRGLDFGLRSPAE